MADTVDIITGVVRSEGGPLTALEFGQRLERSREYIEQADSFAAARFARFPNLSSISLTLEAEILVEFSLTLTWERKR